VWQNLTDFCLSSAKINFVVSNLPKIRADFNIIRTDVVRETLYKMLHNFNKKNKKQKKLHNMLTKRHQTFHK